MRITPESICSDRFPFERGWDLRQMSRPFFLQSFNAGERQCEWCEERNRIPIDEASRRDWLATPPKWLDLMPIEDDGLYSRSPIFRTNRPIAGYCMRMHPTPSHN